ncbi:MAG: type IV pilus assembly protein PilB [Candidatus Paceibacteria bacterium]|jgi:type IV pilus assembly protein PilB
MVIKFNEEEQKKSLATLLKKEEEELAQILSKRYGIPYADLTVFPVDTDGLRLISEENSRKAKVAIFDLVGKRMKVAVLSPNRQETKNQLKELDQRGYVIEPFLVSTQSLERAWDRYKDISHSTASKAGSLDISSDEIREMVDHVQTIDDIKVLVEKTVQMKKAFRLSKIVEIVMAGAIATKTSDIHVEPEGEDVRLRFRLDGILVDIVRLDNETYKLLLSRIKLLSGMKLNIKSTSQDGRFSVKIDQKEIEIRSSVLPGAYNESIVLRLLDPQSIAVPLEELGIEPELLKIFLREANKPNGMILNTGPTGSGKTTTLYAFLTNIKSESTKIITIEDPIEYHLKGIVQTQVDRKKNYDFAKGLKSSLRQDPDVIMVGEIREIETAETAVHAALTGHLVFSTLHTNNAAGAYTRLIDLGINPKILTSAINIVIAQRLVRLLCPQCKKETVLPKDKIDLMRGIYNSIQNPNIDFTEKVYEAVGCSGCNGLGYKGRIGIYEAIISNKEIEAVLQTNPSEREIKKVSRSQGIMDMAEDGISKVLKGITTLSEVERVVDLETRKGFMDKEEITEKTDHDGLVFKGESIVTKDKKESDNLDDSDKNNSEPEFSL